MRRHTTLIYLLIAFACSASGCGSASKDCCASTSTTAHPFTQYFSPSRGLPRISISYDPLGPGYEVKAEVRVIHHDPNLPYNSPRTLFLRAGHATGFSHIFLLDEIDPGITDATTNHGAAIFLAEVSKHGNPVGWAGPYPEDHPRVKEVLARGLDPAAMFSKDYLASDVVALVRDMVFIHGGQDSVYETPYVPNWTNLADEIQSLSDGTNSNSSSPVNIKSDWANVWVKLWYAQGQQLNPGIIDHLLIEIDLKTGRVIWLDIYRN